MNEYYFEDLTPQKNGVKIIKFSILVPGFNRNVLMKKLNPTVSRLIRCTSSLLIIILLWNGCKQSATEAPTVAGTGDFTGYDMQEIPGSAIQRAVMKSANDQISEEGYVLDNKKTGQWIKYNPDGQIATIENYVNGNLHGPYLKFANRGQIEQRMAYQEGMLHGYWYQFKFGNKIEERQYKLGKLDGTVRMYNDKNWKLRQESEYKDGVQHGIYRYYDDDGNVTLEYEYKNGEKIRGGMVNKSE